MLENHFTKDPHKVETFSTPKILVLGHGQHGKDTVSNMISYTYGLKLGGSSELGFKAIKPRLQKLFPNESDEQLFENRRIHRNTWKRLIKEYNTPDPTRLTRDILRVYDGYVGIRDLDEYKATEHLYDIKIWVDRSLHKPNDPSMEIEYDPNEMLLLNNNGPLAHLKDALLEILIL